MYLMAINIKGGDNGPLDYGAGRGAGREEGGVSSQPIFFLLPYSVSSFLSSPRSFIYLLYSFSPNLIGCRLQKPCRSLMPKSCGRAHYIQAAAHGLAGRVNYSPERTKNVM